MGAVVSVVGWVASWFRSEDEDAAPTGAREDPNPVTGLTPRQVRAVQRTFGLFRADLKGFGVDLFMELFTTHPEYQKLFVSFATLPRSKLPTDKKFIAHTSTVAYSLLNIVDHLDDIECLAELLFKVGCNHGRRNIEPKAFQNLRNVIISLLRKKLGNKFTPFVEEAWCKTLDAANSVCFKGLAEGRLQPIPKPSS